MGAKNAKNGSEPEPKEVEHGGKVIAGQILILLISKADGIMTRHRDKISYGPSLVPETSAMGRGNNIIGRRRAAVGAYSGWTIGSGI